MSRGTKHVGRPVAIWLGVTIAVALAATSVPGAWRAAGTGATDVADLLVAGCASGLAVALAWLWVITTVTVAGVLSGRVHTDGGTTRRLVLVACGVVVVAGTSVPALAAGGDGPELLVGLALPQRAVAPARTHRPHLAPPGSYVVRAGDSLWSIARAHPATATSLDERWRAIWQANRDAVGDDPDLILPGQALRLPPEHPLHDPHPDGDRR